jgi:oligopeptide transport system substrate-binding protein
VTAQLFETLTAFDPGLTLRPALAESWSVEDGGRRVVFRLRPGVTFSDGTPITAGDVVASWLRLIDPASPSPLAGLMADVEGANVYLRGDALDPGTVGLRATDERSVEVRLARPGADFPSIVAAPSFGVVPDVALTASASAFDSGTIAASGGYELRTRTAGELTLVANPRYWAGRPAIGTIHLLTDIEAASPVAAFETRELDYAGLSPYDASWIRYDRDLGPQLREVPGLGLLYFGFDTSEPPFDDVRVRRAFAAAVDWSRIVDLGSTGTAIAASTMVPPGIPGRSDRDFGPVHDPDAARTALAEAGFVGGKGFPEVTLVTYGAGHEEAVIAQLYGELGVRIGYEFMDFGLYTDRLDEDPPDMWSLLWSADYPGPNDFLGILLETGASNNAGRWSSADFDEAIAEALATGDPAASRVAYDRAEAIVQRDVPVIPVEYGSAWALSRDGLLGAIDNGLGGIRMAGLAWR